MKKKINLTEALNWNDQYDKMRDWHYGARGANLNAMSKDKLEMNARICQQNGWLGELSQLEAVARSKGIVLSTMSPVSQKPAAKKPAAQPAPNVDLHLNFDENDFLIGLAKFVKESDAEEIIKFALSGNCSIKHLFVFLVYAIVLKCSKEKIARLKEFLNINCGMDIQTIKDNLNSIISDSKIQEVLNKIIELFCESLHEDVEKHDELNPKLWNKDNTLKEEVKEKINLIIDEFLDGVTENEVSINLKDVILVGSNCSYNYNKDSDLDIHLIAESIEAPEDLYSKLYSAYRSIFNKNLDIDFYGIPVEIFVESENTPGIYNGVYSVMQNKWLQEPVAEDIPEIDKEALNKEVKVWEDRYTEIVDSSKKELKESKLNEALRSINKMEIIVSILNYVTGNNYDYLLEKEPSLGGKRDLPKYIIHHADKNHENNSLDNLYILNRQDHLDYCHGLKSWEEIEKIYISDILNTFINKKDYQLEANVNESLNEEIENKQLTEIEKYIEDLYELRKDGLAKDGQYGIGNLVFKEIRNKGYLDKLKDLKNELIGKELSLESLKEDYNEYYSDEFEEYFNKGNNEQFNELIDELNFDYNNFSESEKKDLYQVWKGIISKDEYLKHRQWDKEQKYSLEEVWTNGAGPGFYETIDYIEKELADKNIKYELTEIDGYYYFDLYDENDKFMADEIICKYAGDNYEWKNNYSCKVELEEQLDERLEERQRINYRQELSRISFNQAIVYDNGLFHIYNIKEDDIDRIVRRIRELPYIEWVQKNDSGNYDFSKVAMFGQPQAKYYNITGKIKEEN